MNILMIARSTLFTSPGGDTTQIEMTAKYLRKLNINVDIALSTDKIDYRKYHLLHFFNIIRPADILPHIKHYQPYVISTIFVDYYEFEKKTRQGVFGLANKFLNRDALEYMKSIIRFLKNGEKINSIFYLFNGQRKSIKYLIKKSSILLPNSHSEYNRLSESYNIDHKYQKVVNAIDRSVFNDDIDANQNFKDHVLCIGRIEGRKNQLNLIKALLNTSINLTIIGRPSPNHIGYFNECLRLSKSSNNVQIIQHIEHEKLAGIYKAAKVHVLPSWFETTGLSSLEAAAMGCNVVITEKGDTREYFGDLAFYCIPDNINSIKDAVLKAFYDPVKPELQKLVFNNYSWENTAAQTLKAYKLILEK